MEYKNLRLLVDTLYKLQQFREMFFTGTFEAPKIQNNFAIDIINTLNNLQSKFAFSDLISHFREYTNRDLQFQSIAFGKYTNNIITPIIDIINTSTGQYNNKYYIQLIKFIEHVSFQKAALYQVKDNSLIAISSLKNIYAQYNFLIKKYHKFNNTDVTIEGINKDNYWENLSKYIVHVKILENEILNYIYDTSCKISAIPNKILPLVQNFYKQNKLNKDNLDLILSVSNVIILNRGNNFNIIDNNGCYICLSGAIKIFTVDNNGQEEAIIDLLDTHSVFLSDFCVSNTNLECLHSETVLLYIEKNKYEEIIQSSNDLSILFKRKIIDYVKRKNDTNANIRAKPVKDRIANFLLLYKTENKNIVFGKHNIAKFLNMRPETFSRMLKTIKEEENKDESSLCQYCSKYIYEICLEYNPQKSHKCPFQ